MSKQLTISASIAVLCMGLLAVAASLGTPRTGESPAHGAPLFELTAGR